MSAVQRTAPGTGYDFGNKRQYRREVWANFRRHTGAGTSDAHALLMPSIEGDEIEVALDNGFHERNLHVVDKNPAIVATLKRRYPMVNTYGVSAWRACQRIADLGVGLSCANFDFCYKIARPIAEELFLIGGVRPFAREAMIAVTVLRGRESKDYFSLISDNGGGDVGRIATIGNALQPIKGETPLYTITPLRHGTYRSTAGSQTMLFSIFSIQDELLTLKADIESIQLRQKRAESVCRSAADRLGDFCGGRTKAKWMAMCAYEGDRATAIMLRVLHEVWKGDLEPSVRAAAKRIRALMLSSPNGEAPSVGAPS